MQRVMVRRLTPGVGPVAIVLAATVLAVGGCGSSTPEEPRVATALSTPATPDASASPSAAPAEQALRFVRCMREKGVAVRDPEPDGRVPVQQGDKTDPDYTTAMRACKPLMPQQGGPGAPPAFTAEQFETMRRYAACMRDNGVPDFADPGPGGFATPPRDAAAAERARPACAAIIGADPNGSGQG